MAIDQHVHRLTVQEYRQVVDSGALRTARVELLDGLLVDMSPVSEPRVRVIQELDVCFTGDRRRRRDLRKAAVYAAAGVPVYWLVDVQRGVVLEHTVPGADGYGVVRTLRDDDVLDAGREDMSPINVAALLGR